MTGGNPAAARVSANVKALRVRSGWTQAEFGQRLGLGWSATTVGQAENGRRAWTADEIVAAAQLFGCDPGALFREICGTCLNQPPAGLACRACGAAA